MGWDLQYREEFFAPVLLATALQRLRGSLVPADSPTWRDGYQPGAGQLWQGSVAADGTFALERLPTVGKPLGRNAGPQPITGQVLANGTGCRVRFAVRPVPGAWMLLWFQVALVSTLVLGASAAVWYNSRHFPCFGLGVLVVLPLFSSANLYFTLFQEAEQVRPVLIELLRP